MQNSALKLFATSTTTEKPQNRERFKCSIHLENTTVKNPVTCCLPVTAVALMRGKAFGAFRFTSRTLMRSSLVPPGLQVETLGHLKHR